MPQKHKVRAARSRHRAAVLLGLLATGGELLTGCQAVPLAEQRLVAKTEMTFESSAAGHPDVNVLAQIEPGLATSGGAQAAGCTSCR